MKNQKGFAVLEGLLVLVIIAMLAGIGWYVMKASKSTNETLSKTDNSQTQKQNKASLTSYTLTNEKMTISYAEAKWKVAQKGSSVDEQCGGQDTLQLTNVKHPNIDLDFSFGSCGKGGGICFFDGSPECVSQSSLIKKVNLAGKDAYIVATRFSSDSGKTWTYELALSDTQDCKGPCFYTAKNVEEKVATVGTSSGDTHYSSSNDFIMSTPIQDAIAVLSTAKY